MLPITADLIIEPTWMLPIAPARTVLTGHSVAIRGANIVAIGPSQTIQQQFRATASRRLDGQLLMPGLVNAHGHAAMVLLRGLAEDLPLDAWLRNKIWPLEAQWVTPEFVADGVALALLEMLKSGTTCFSDMYYFPEGAAHAARDCGMRAQITFPLIDFANAWSKNAAEGFNKGLALHDEYRDDVLIRIGFGPHSAYTLSENELLKTLTLADEIDAPIHMHLHETAGEVATARRDLGCTHIQRLAQIGMLVPRLQAVHLTQLDDADLDALVEGGVRAVHCPQSNLKLGSGVTDVCRMQRRGLLVGLGTDGAAANNSLDMFTEARTAALLAKTVSGDPTALDAHAALELATLGGARALGLDAIIGSIEPGKAADLISIDLTHAGALPVHRPESTLLYTASGSHVQNVWVAGRQLLIDGNPTTLDVSGIHARAATWARRLATPVDGH
jgi:5-methylthioadenosine/S-adenosylhomocysteine deaminase